MDWQKLIAVRGRLFAIKCCNYTLLVCALLAVIGVVPFSEYPQSALLIIWAVAFLGFAAITMLRIAKVRRRRENSN